MPEKENKKLEALLMAMRRALLMQVDAIEQCLEMERTSDVRKAYHSQFNDDNITFTGEGLA